MSRNSFWSMAGLPLIMEIDCSSEKSLINAINYLKLDINEGYTESKYKNIYDIPYKFTQSIKSLTFKNY